MKKINYFGKTFVPVLILMILMVATTGLSAIAPMIRDLLGGHLDSQILDVILNSEDAVLANFIYGLAGVIIFSIWYNQVFVAPFREKERKLPGGYSLHTILSFLFIAIGMQYLALLLKNVVTTYLPEALLQYDNALTSLGTKNITIVVVIYTVLLAPIMEELVFRGLVFRYARHAMPFWVANVWQAFLFALVHLNVLQGAFTFLLGLLLGWMAKRGRGIRYTIPVHIIFNVIGLYFSGLIDVTTSIGQIPACILGIALLCFGLWLYYTDFKIEKRDPDR